MGFIPIDFCRVANIGKGSSENEGFSVEMVEIAVKYFFSDEDMRCRPGHETILLSCGCGGKRFFSGQLHQNSFFSKKWIFGSIHWFENKKINDEKYKN